MSSALSRRNKAAYFEKVLDWNDEIINRINNRLTLDRV